ncbi:hypothetical protein VTP01DRAFT_873 [Rhizomucor pusillus]|uniref:uncharacterized protein n=1 Tax=Rhizomucor pusillus TaxID=4840 RepID=UPI003741F94E
MSITWNELSIPNDENYLIPYHYANTTEGTVSKCPECCIGGSLLTSDYKLMTFECTEPDNHLNGILLVTPRNTSSSATSTSATATIGTTTTPGTTPGATSGTVDFPSMVHNKYPLIPDLIFCILIYSSLYFFCSS